MSSNTLRKVFFAYLLLLIPISWLATKFEPYQIDGDAMCYMDVADLMRAHHWAGVVNGYWNPLYPAAMALTQIVLHPTRMNELGAYYVMNFVIFLASVVAMLAFVTALVKLRKRMLPSADQDANASPMLGLNALRLLGVGLVVIAAQRELSMGKVRPDALLQTLMLAAFAMLLQSLASESLVYAPLMGLFLGMAYLSKSFAFLIAFISIAVMMVFQAWLQKRKPGRVVAGGALAFVVFAAVAGPYIVALSKQKHRFDFGDSGALNYAWYVSGTDKMHLEPWMTGDFGSADVKLVHPEKQLLAQPGVYSYKAEAYGEYPDWFDPTYFNDHIVPKFNAKRLLKRDVRNLVLCSRYFLNHPEAWILLAVLLGNGARFRVRNWRHEGFWLPMIVLGLAMWGIYGLVNIEERYVTLAYLVLVLPVFAMLRSPGQALLATERGAPVQEFALAKLCQRPIAVTLVALFAFLALGETLRIALEERRNESGRLPSAWYSPEIYGAAKGLADIGVKPGDEIACIGTTACLHDPYWQRLAGVRMLTEVYNPADKHLEQQLEGLPNRQQVYDVVKAQGAKVMVAYFDPGEMTGRNAGSAGWIRLGETGYYALPLNLDVPVPPAAPAQPWTPKMEVAP